MESQAKTISDMPDKQNKKKAVKELNKEIEKLRDEYKKIEIRPCQGDTDLHQRENELEILKSKIYELEKERDTYLYSWSH
jgi:chromosome segregation ATPase